MNEPQPISRISGNIEITFNTKEKDLDPYEPILEQVVLTIGKSGRANRLTFNDLDSESIYNAAETLTEIADQINEIEEAYEEIKEGDFDIDIIKKGTPDKREAKVIKETLETIEDIEKYSNNSEISIEKIKKHVDTEFDFSDEEIKEAIETLKAKGEVFQPNSKEPMQIQRI